ncbi:MAG TPA: hypothetical protein VHB79_30690 [Polyangiaceae bacterium]|nr:hypothetical protein [Polyangiaceae bacterium]
MLGRSTFSLVVAALLLAAGPTHAAPKAKWKPAAAKPAKKGKEADKKKEEEKEKDSEKEKEQPEEKSSSADDAKAATKEEGVKSAGTASPKSQDTSNVKVKEDKEGVKTYKFETVEVEGRLKSPQVIYFLRRVRAEFDAGALGHRSFLGELSDSRRSAAFR